MKKNMEIIDRIKLMMSYNSEKTLNENVNIFNENKSTEVDESRSALTKELKALGLGTKETAVISAMGKEFGLADNLIATALIEKNLTQLTKELEIAVNADLKNGVRQNLGPLAKQASKLKAMKEMFDKSQALKKVGKELTTKEITSIIERTKGEAKSMSQKLEGKYVARIAKRDAKRIKRDADALTNTNLSAVESGGNLTNASKEATAAGDNEIAQIIKDANKAKDAGPSRWERWKEWAERHPKSKKFLYLLGFGGATYAAYQYLLSDTTPEEAKKLTFNNCVGSLIDDEGTTILTTTGGEPVIKVTKTGNQEYDSKGGVMFYNNGRVFMTDQSKRGFWSCKGKLPVIAENDLLNEQGNVLSDEQMNDYVDTAVDDLDGYVAEYNLKSLMNILTALKGKTYEGQGALQQFLKFYKEDEGVDFLEDVNSVGVSNLSVTAKNMKPKIVAMVSGAALGGDGKSATGVDSIINIKWDGAKSGGGDGKDDGNKKGGQKYYDCTKVNLDTTALTYGCKDNRVAEVQKCLGITADGKFGPATRKALVDNAYDASKGITKEIYTKVLAGCKKDKTTPTTGSTEGGADVNYLRNPIKLDLGPTPQLPKFSRNSETNEEFYNRFVANGNFRAGEIGSNRVKYKGADLNVEDLKKLNDHMTSNGYVLIKSKDKGAQYDGGENEKYVWQKSE